MGGAPEEKRTRRALPYFEWYTGDWWKETRTLSMAAKGGFADLRSAMWDAQNRGILTLRIEQYARLMGAEVEQADRIIAELVRQGALLCERSGNGIVTLWYPPMVARSKELQQNRLRVERHRRKKE